MPPKLIFENSLSGFAKKVKRYAQKPPPAAKTAARRKNRRPPHISRDFP
jgi:hypothetical protein